MVRPVLDATTDEAFSIAIVTFAFSAVSFVMFLKRFPYVAANSYAELSAMPSDFPVTAAKYSIYFADSLKRSFTRSTELSSETYDLNA